MRGLPIVEIQDQETFTSPTFCASTPFRNYLDGNEMKAFHVSLDLRTINFLDTAYSGLFCDYENFRIVVKRHVVALAINQVARVQECKWAFFF